MGLVFYALAAMTWNTGELTSAKIEAQSAADAAAYSSAVWTSRAINMVTATNQLALRDASAAGVAVAVLFEGTWVLIMQTYYFASKIAPHLAGLPATLPIIAPLLVLYTADLALWLTFIAKTGWPIMPILDLAELIVHLVHIRQYQADWIAELPGLIAAQEAELEAYYDCDIQLTLGNGSTSISPPLHPGTQLTCVVPFTARFVYDALADGSWRKDVVLDHMLISESDWGWAIGSLLGYVGGLTGLGFTHHVLSSQPQYLPLELGPYGWGVTSDPATWADFTVLASARKRANNQQSRQLPQYPLRFMAPGLFGESDNLRPVAYAQAETFNGIEGLFFGADIPGVNLLKPVLSAYPWRVWTDWGWQWQPRLTHGSLVHPGVFQGTGLDLNSFGSAFPPQFHETLATH